MPDERLSVALDWIRRTSCGREHILVAIDGRCASGKTTLAAAISDALGCLILHMDDFFLRPEQRTPERLAIPGENVDHERFLEELLLPLSKGRAAIYRPFQCKTQTLGVAMPIIPTPVIVVEGSYSCHPTLRNFYDLRLFLTVDPDIQMERILRRNGEAAAEIFRTRWIPLEERYFDRCGVRECCIEL